MLAPSDDRRRIDCVVCRADTVSPSRTLQDGQWPLWECRTCGVRFVWPAPSEAELARVYEWAYRAVRTAPPSPRTRTAKVRMFARLLDRADVRSIPGRRLLDVGCAQGEMLEAGQLRGWSVEGVELDPATANATGSRLGVPVRAGQGLRALASGERYDLIVMSHWLEHIPIPSEALALVRDRLTPNGRLLLRVPNTDSRVGRLTGVYWSWFIPPTHLVYFNRHSLEVVAPQFGLQVVSMSVRRGDAHFVPLELAWSILRRIRGGRLSPTPESGDVTGLARWWALNSTMNLAFTWIDGLPVVAGIGNRWEDSELVAVLAAG